MRFASREAEVGESGVLGGEEAVGLVLVVLEGVFGSGGAAMGYCFGGFGLEEGALGGEAR